MEPKNNPSTPSLEHQRLQPSWKLWDDLRSTATMREAGERLLPRDEAEEPAQYEARLNRSKLYPAAHDTHGKIVAKPFQKPVQLRMDEDDPFAQIVADDIDRCGCNLGQFASQALGDAVARSVTYAIATHGAHSGADPTPIRTGKVRAAVRHIEATRMLDYETAQQADGSTACVLARWTESIVKRDGDFGQVAVERVRRWRVESDGKKSVTVWESRNTDDGQAWVELSEFSGELTYRGPGLPVERLKLEDEPPLQGLAELNVEHWQVKSDRSNLVHVQCCPVLTGTGITLRRTNPETKRMEEVKIRVGPRSSLLEENADARWSYTEPTGSGAKTAKELLDDIRAEMEVLGLQPFLRQGSAAATATQQRADSDKADSQIQRWIRATEVFLRNIFEHVYRWRRKQDGPNDTAPNVNDVPSELPEGFAVNIYDEFTLDVMRDADIAVLERAQMRGLLTRKTFLGELDRRGIFAEGFDAERELEEASEEIMVAGTPADSPSDDLPGLDDDEGDE